MILFLKRNLSNAGNVVKTNAYITSYLYSVLGLVGVNTNKNISYMELRMDIHTINAGVKNVGRQTQKRKENTKEIEKPSVFPTRLF